MVFPRKLFTWRVRSFLTILEFFSAKQSFLQNSGKLKINLIPHLFQYGLWTRRIGVWHPWPKVANKLLKILSQSPRIEPKFCFFIEKKSFFWKCISGHMECSFGKSVNFVLPEILTILVHSRKVRKSFVSSRKCFLKMFRWRRRRPSWQNPSFCAIQNFLNKFRRERWNWFFSGNLFKTVFGHVYFSFETPGEVYGQKRKFFTQCQKMGSKSYFFREKLQFSQSVSLDTRNAVLTTLLKLFRQKTENFRSVHKTQEFLVFPKNSSSKLSTGHVKCLLDDQGVFLKVKMFSAKPWKDIKI